MKENLTNYFNFMKEHKAVIKNTKLVLLIIVNIWLFAIFWKILILSDINIINNNHLLTKATLLFQPILSVLGIDLLTPNMLKMIVLSFIVIFTNLSVLYFNQMASIIILSVFARYSYKSYTNYLINKENLNYLGFENKKEIVEEIPQVIIQQVPQVIESSTNWWQWGAIGCVCLIAVGGIIFMVWSHNQSMNGIIDTNENVKNVIVNVKDMNTHINERITRSASQIDYNNNYTTNLFKGLDKKVDLIDEKVKDLNWTVQSVGENLTKVAELNNKNTLALSQQSLNLSRQASEALTEIADSTTVVEATTVGLAHIWEIVKGFSTRIEVLEAKSNITTPRASMHFKAPPMPPHKDDM
jgi:hypothetical protein